MDKSEFELNIIDNNNQNFNGVIILDWLEQIKPILLKSKWKEAIKIENICVLDVLRSYLYIILAGLIRENSYDHIYNKDNSLLSKFSYWLNNKTNSGMDRIYNSILTNQTRKPTRTHIVFWPWQVMHLKGQVPVAKELTRLGVDYEFAVSSIDAFRKLRSNGINAIASHIIWKDSIVQARLNSKKFISILEQDPEVELPSFSCFLSKQEIIQAIRFRIISLLPLVHEIVITANMIIEEFSPKVIIVGNDLTLVGQIGCLKGREKGIASICLMHGALAGDVLQKYHIADYFFVYGKLAAKQLLHLGINKKMISICGAPYLDNLPKQIGVIDPLIQKKLKIGNKKYVLVATSGPGHSISLKHHLRLIEEIMKISIKYSEVLFIAKLHKKDKIEYYEQVKKIVSRSKVKVIAFNEHGYPTDIFSWLQGCSVVITCASAVSVEAMLLDVPVITIDFESELSGVDFIDAKATIHVRTKEELESSLYEVINNSVVINRLKKRVTKYLTNNFYNLDGNASKRSANAIQKLILGSNENTN